MTDRAVQAQLIGEVGRPARLGQHRRVQLQTGQRPGPGADVREPLTVRRDRRHRRGGVVRADGGHRHRTGQPGLLQHPRAQHPGRIARPPQRREQLQVDAEPRGHVVRPVTGTRVDELGGGGVGQLRALLTGEPVRQQVRDEQQPLRLRQLGGTAGGHQLVQGVERRVLEPGRRVQLGGRNRLPHLLGDALGTGVPVVHRVAEQRPVRVQQPVVHGPAVDADGVHLPCRPQTVQDAPVQPQHVPAQPLGDPHRAVGEAVRLGQLQRVGADAADHDTPAGGAQVDRGVRRHTHRRNAAATPASTGTCSPVVCVSSPPVSANTALATCSGSTSRLRMVRWA